MGLLKPSKNQTAFMKVGILGFAGSGKTFTGTDLAIGLAKLSGGKQIAFFDSEKGSDFIGKRVEDAGLELLVHKGRAFADLVSIIKEAEQANIPVLIIDSISHVWRDLCDSYQKKYKRSRLTMGDWGALKGQWKEYVDLYINSKVHIIMLGRAGHEYDWHEGEDGKSEIIKTGTKMKVEGETGFEPDLLLEMERIKTKDGIINRCYVLKDRSNSMNGSTLDNPTFKSFEPFVKFLNIGGDHVGLDTQRNSVELFDDPDWSYEERKRRREIAIEDLSTVLIKLGMDGTSNEAKRKRVDLLETTFQTAAKTAIENLPLQSLVDGIERIKATNGLTVPSKPDDIPDFDAKRTVA